MCAYLTWRLPFHFPSMYDEQQASPFPSVRGLFFSKIGEFMVRVLEIVLDIPEPAARVWSALRERSHRAHAADRLDATLVKVLAGLPQVVCAMRGAASGDRSSAVAGSMTITRFDRDGTLAASGLQVQLDDAAGERRVMVSQLAPYSPGVTLRETRYAAPYEGPPAGGALPGAALTGAPETLRHRLAAAGDLLPVTTLAFERNRWQWRSADGGVVDIVFDHRTTATEAAALLQRELRLTTPYVEDAVGASLAALFALANQLVAALPAFPVLRTALDRVCAGSGAPEPAPARAVPIDLAGVSTPHAALTVIGGNLADHWFGNDAGVRDAVSTEFVHQMRVAQRRLRTAIRIFPHWADDLWKTRIAPDLKWLGGILGEARDWDVFVDSTLPALAAADADGARWNSTRETADAQRLEVRERAQAAVGSTRYAQLALAWLEWLSALSLRKPPAKATDVSLCAYARKCVNRYYKRLISAPKLTAIDDAARHKERIQAKYLRYTLEFFESIAAPKTRGECAKTVSRMQTVLGDGNDVAVALRYLEQLNVEPYQAGFARGWCEASKRYTAQEGERLLRSLRKPKITGGEAG